MRYNRYRLNRHAADELKQMTPYLLLFNGAAVAVCIGLGFAFGFDWRLYTGLAVGNVLMLANFVLIGFTADKVVKCRDFSSARSISRISYGLRYIGMFAVLAGLLTVKVIDPIAAVVPLIYPKVYYSFFYIKFISVKEEQKNDN